MLRTNLFCNIWKATNNGENPPIEITTDNMNKLYDVLDRICLSIEDCQTDNTRLEIEIKELKKAQDDDSWDQNG